MTHAEASLVEIDDTVSVKIAEEGWVTGIVEYIVYPPFQGRSRGYQFGIRTSDGRELPDVPARFVKWRRRGRKQDWSPRGGGPNLRER